MNTEANEQQDRVEQIVELERENTALREEIEALRDQKSRNQKKILDTEHARDLFKAAATGLESRRNEALHDRDTLREEVEALQCRLEAAQGEVDASRRQMYETESRGNKLRAQYRVASSRIGELETDNDRLRNEDNAEAEMGDINKTDKVVRDFIYEHSIRLDDTVSRLDAMINDIQRANIRDRAKNDAACVRLLAARDKMLQDPRLDEVIDRFDSQSEMLTQALQHLEGCDDMIAGLDARIKGIDSQSRALASVFAEKVIQDGEAFDNLDARIDNISLGHVCSPDDS